MQRFARTELIREEAFCAGNMHVFSGQFQRERCAVQWLGTRQSDALKKPICMTVLRAFPRVCAKA